MNTQQLFETIERITGHQCLESEMFEIIKTVKKAESKPCNMHGVSNSLPDFGFAEWLGRNYIRLNKVWVHRYADQRDENNLKTTEQLNAFWINGGNDC